LSQIGIFHESLIRATGTDEGDFEKEKKGSWTKKKKERKGDE